MDSATLANAMGNTLPQRDYDALVPACNQAMVAAGVTTVERAAMWLAQLGHESVGLKYLTELWGPTTDQRSYEGRSDLGNTVAGDGYRFRGRGAIMITGRAHYANLSRWAHNRGLVPSPTYFVDNPDQLASPTHCFVGAQWYWTVARPQLNALADARDLDGATRAINGALNGIDDRRNRYRRCLALGSALLPERTPTVEKVLDYPRDQVTQDTFYNCGPASTQTVLRAKGIDNPESVYGRQLGTDTDGTDTIEYFPRVLNAYVPQAAYVARQMPNDPPSTDQVDRLWRDVVASIDAGYGVIANIVAPPSNYPRGVKGSVSPSYSGGTVFHYIALMGYADDDGDRAIWVADSGFRPFGYWISLSQLATLIPPKGYAYSTAQPTEEDSMTAADDELTKRFPSRSKYRANNDPVDTLAGFVLNIDARIHEEYVEREALKGVSSAIELVKREAAKGDAGAKATLAQIQAT